MGQTQHDVAFFFKRCAGHYQKKYPKSFQNRIKIEPKSTQNASKRRLRRPPERLRAHFGYKPYFETLSGVIFRGFGRPGGPLGLSLGRPFRDLSPSGRAQDPKMDAFLGDLFSDHFFTRVSMDFGGVPEGKTVDSVWEW